MKRKSKHDSNPWIAINDDTGLMGKFSDSESEADMDDSASKRGSRTDLEPEDRVKSAERLSQSGLPESEEIELEEEININRPVTEQKVRPIDFSSPGNNCEATEGLYLYQLYERFKNLISKNTKHEFKYLFHLAWPIALAGFLTFLVPVVMLFFVGHLGKTSLAGAGLGLAFCNVTGVSFSVGILAACDTLCSQAFGARNFRRVGVVVQRGCLIISLMCLPIIGVWINTENILLLLHQEPKVARQSQEFALFYIPALIFYSIYSLIHRFLACQGIVYPLIIASLGANVFNALFNYLFIHAMDIGIRGGALAVGMSYLLLCVTLIIIIRWKRLHEKTWQGWSWESLYEWKQFMALGIPGFLMIIIEWWSFEIGSFLMGLINEVQLATQTTLFNIAVVIYRIGLGMAIAASVRVGHFLGAGQPTRAFRTMKTSVGMTVIGMSFICLFIIILKDVLGYLFTKDTAVIHEIGRVLPLVAVFEILDCTQAVCAGVIRGLGLQKWGALINFIGIEVLGLPIGIALAFLALRGVLGLWFGYGIGIVFQVVVFTVFLYRVNWRKHSLKAMKRCGVTQGFQREDNLNEERPQDADASEALTAETTCSEATVSEEKDPVNTSTEVQDEAELMASQSRIFFSDSDPARPPARLLIEKTLFLISAILVLVVGIVVRITV